jgi:hypothetical protein
LEDWARWLALLPPPRLLLLLLRAPLPLSPPLLLLRAPLLLQRLLLLLPPLQQVPAIWTACQPQLLARLAGLKTAAVVAAVA